MILHCLHVDGVCLFQHLHHIAHRGAILQDEFAVVMELGVAKPVEIRGREYVQGIVGWYLHVPIVDVPEKGIERGPRGNKLPKRDLHLTVLRHEGTEESLKVGTSGGQYGPVREDNIIPYFQCHISERVADVGVEELVQVILKGGDGRKDHILLSVGVWGVGSRPELLPAYNLDHEGLVEALKGRAHDDLAKVALPDDELHAVVFEAGQLELRGTPEHLQDAVHIDRGLDVLHAQELQTLGLQEDGQLVDVHHGHDLGHTHPFPRVVLQLRVDVVRVHEVQGHVERPGRDFLQVDTKRSVQDKGRRGCVTTSWCWVVGLQKLPSQEWGPGSHHHSMGSHTLLLATNEEVDIAELLPEEELLKVIDEGALGEGGELDAVELSTPAGLGIDSPTKHVHGITADSS